MTTLAAMISIPRHILLARIHQLEEEYLGFQTAGPSVPSRSSHEALVFRVICMERAVACKKDAEVIQSKYTREQWDVINIFPSTATIPELRDRWDVHTKLAEATFFWSNENDYKRLSAMLAVFGERP